MNIGYFSDKIFFLIRLKVCKNLRVGNTKIFTLTKTKKVSTIKLAIFFWFKVWVQTRNKDLRILISQIKAFFLWVDDKFRWGKLILDEGTCFLYTLSKGYKHKPTTDCCTDKRQLTKLSNHSIAVISLLSENNRKYICCELTKFH